MKEIFEDALNLLFPIDEYCMFCKKRTRPYKHYLCNDCYTELCGNFYSCKYCGITMQDRSFEICETCAKGDIDFNAFIKSYKLTEQAKTNLYAYKNGRKRELSYCFASLLEEKIRENINVADIDFIIPVPSSKYKLRKRGFDHIADIVKKLSSSLNITYEMFLQRDKDSKEQKTLNKIDRIENMVDAFSLKIYTNSPIKVILVDDVLTTGATMRSSARALKLLNIEAYGLCVFHAQP